MIIGVVKLDELTLYQAVFINRMLTDLKKRGISQNEFAASIGTTPVTVSRWKNGKNPISKHFAAEIADRYPEYPISEITGFRDKMREQAKEQSRVYAEECACFEQLLKLNGIDEILKADPTPWRVGGAVVNGGDEFAKLLHGEETLTLTTSQYEAFRKELFDYARMRLDSMFERGGW